MITYICTNNEYMGEGRAVAYNEMLNHQLINWEKGTIVKKLAFYKHYGKDWNKARIINTC